MKNKLITKLTQDLVIYQVQFQVNQLINEYTKEVMQSFLFDSVYNSVINRHYENLVLTYGPQTVWTVIDLTFAKQVKKVS